MVDYPRFEYSRSELKEASKRLSENIQTLDYDVIKTFKIAHSWRNSHIYPMRGIRLSLQHHLRKAEIGGITAARPKRMESIRRKLEKKTVELHQMNDLGGCRAILDDISGVRQLIEILRSRTKHTIRREYPYIDAPKDDGYRSHHMVFNFEGRGVSEVFSGRRIELQIRTRLQHSWATSVEAIGLFRGEDLKHGNGNEEWLRLLNLVSAEFSYAEGCAIHPSMPARSDRIKEIRDLDAKLRAADVLENIKHATHYAESFIHSHGMFYLIRYRKDHTVVVETYDSASAWAVGLDNLENLIEAGGSDEKVVLVEVDKVDKLVETYPNYFGDVSLFVSNLRKICSGKDAIQYSMAPQKLVAPRPHEKPDVSLLYRRYNYWVDKPKGK